ncbi:o-succinylbenzoate synthase [Sporosarcina sp. CAU 1771]
MIIKEIIVRAMKMKMKKPFTTSFGTVQEKKFLLIEVIDELGSSGWGESVAFEAPWYTEETYKMNKHIIQDFLIPLVLGKEIKHPDEVTQLFAPVRQNNMSKSAIEGAIWDAYAKRNRMSLSEALGGTLKKIDVGISIGIQKSEQELVDIVRSYIEEGYKRVKVKIMPGKDIVVIRELRKYFPDIPLMVDANSAYTLADVELLQRFDEFNLLMIEQPLAADDFIDHAVLQKELKTPICLDESIHSFEDTRIAIELGSCQVINVKSGRVGGLTEAKKIHDYCMAHQIPVWCGGMFESGIGRAHSVALSSLSNFVLPGDIAGSSRYWKEDVIAPEVIVENGYITVPTDYGIGYEPNMKVMDKYTTRKRNYRA